MLPDALFYIHDLLIICYYALCPEPNAWGADGRIRWRPAVHSAGTSYAFNPHERLRVDRPESASASAETVSLILMYLIYDHDYDDVHILHKFLKFHSNTYSILYQ